MGVESATDRATMLAVSDFGVSVTFSPGDSYPNRNDETADIIGIFDNNYFEVEGVEASYSSSQPTLVVRTADVTDAQRNSMVEIGGDVYKVVRVEPDGTGITVLILEGPRAT